MQMWFLAEERVHHVHLLVPRTLYVDSEIALENAPLGALRFSQATPGACACVYVCVYVCVWKGKLCCDGVLILVFSHLTYNLSLMALYKQVLPCFCLLPNSGSSLPNHPEVLCVQRR